MTGDTKWGFHGGAFGEAAVADNLYVNLGVNYSRKGGEGFAGAGLLDAERVRVDLDYVELPLLAELSLPLGRRWQLLAYGGITAAFNVSCKAALGGGEKAACRDTELGGARTEWGLPAGGGLSYTLDNGEMIVFEARHTWGLNAAVSDVDVRTRSWQFVVRLVRGV